MRAIDADKLLKKKVEIYIPPEDPEETWCFGGTVVVIPVDDVKEAPTITYADLVPHGYWHIDDYDSGDPEVYAAFIEVHCSKCGYGLGAESGQYGWSYGDPFPLNYCPNCGAKMDGGNEK